MIIDRDDDHGHAGVALAQALEADSDAVENLRRGIHRVDAMEQALGDRYHHACLEPVTDGVADREQGLTVSTEAQIDIVAADLGRRQHAVLDIESGNHRSHVGEHGELKSAGRFELSGALTFDTVASLLEHYAELGIENILDEIRRRVAQVEGGVMFAYVVVRWPQGRGLESQEFYDVLDEVHQAIGSSHVMSNPLSSLNLIRSLPGRDASLPRRARELRYLPDEALHRVCERTEITPAQIADDCIAAAKAGAAIAHVHVRDPITGAPLFRSDTKFESGTGWPSFTRPLEPDNIREKEDRSLFMARTEVRSKHGDSHLGHLFPDGRQEASCHCSRRYR